MATPPALTTSQLVQSNAPYHSRILSALAALDYVPSAVAHQASYVKDLIAQLKHSEKRLEGLKQVTMRERKEHEALRDSTARRLAHKLTGRREKFARKASKEERYVP